MSIPMKSNDPAYWMLQKGVKEEAETPDSYDWRSKPKVFLKGCYICEDPEFALMGMPLCFECPWCLENDKQGHVAADDTICNDCGGDAYEHYVQNQES